MKKLFNFLGFLFQTAFVIMLIFNLIETSKIEDPGFWDYAYVVIDLIIMIPLVSYMAVNHLVAFIIYAIKDAKEELAKLEKEEAEEKQKLEDFKKKYNIRIEDN